MQHQKNQKGIKQFRIKSRIEDQPYKQMSPYQLILALNQAIKGRYDIQFTQCLYKIKENKDYLRFNNFNQPSSKIQIDRTVNNIFSSHPQLSSTIFSDVIELKPPVDFDPNSIDENLQAQKQKEQKDQIEAISKNLKFIMKIHQANNTEQLKKIKAELNPDIKSTDAFKKRFDSNFKDHEMEVFVKGITTPNVIEKIDQQKNTKNPIEIKGNRYNLKLYLHPIGEDSSFLEKIKSKVDLSRITSWGLCTIPEQGNQKEMNNNAKKIKGYSYFDMSILQSKLQQLNSSICIQNSLTLRQRDDIIQGFDLVSFLYGEVALKISLNLGQVSKISRSKVFAGDKMYEEFYFHLKYPAKLFMTLLKKESAARDDFIKKWERLQNFPLMRNQFVKKNDFLRLYLFNNTILKITLKNDQYGRYSIDKSLQKMEKLIAKFEGIYPCQIINYKIDFSISIKTFEKEFNYKKFLECLRLQNQQQKDKIWKIKYFILVMVRFNLLNPKQINELLDKIQQNQEYLNLILYIFWRTSTSIWGFQRTDMRFYEYLITQFEKNKQLQGIDIVMNRMIANTDQIAQVFRASLTPSGYLYNPPTPQMKGRMLKQYSDQSQFFLRVAICEDSQTTLKNQKYITKEAFRKMMNQIHIIDRLYIPLGWSPSQLRSYSLWYMNQVHKQKGKLIREYVISFLGYFDNIPNPAKKAARIGQSFSSSWTFYLDGTKIIEKRQDDVRSKKKFLYTDGIGKISSNLLQKISLKLNLRDLSVIQMRYKGTKGVLVMDQNLPKNTIVLRKSLIKYQCTHPSAEKYLDILDWNKFKPGFLNRQIIILLKTLGIKDEIFKKLQDQHIQNIESLSFKDCSIFTQMNDDLNTQICNLQPANQTILQLLRSGFTLQSQPFFRGVLQTLKKNGYYQLKSKSSIRIQKSARIIGIIDQHEILDEGQIYCSIMNQFSQIQQKRCKKENIEGDVIITRNPCLHPADIRKVKCIGDQQIKKRFQEKGISQNLFEPYVNTVIFPMKGAIPITAQISGSDLDGDNFFICWDDRLVPKAHQKETTIDDPVATQINKKDPKQIGYKQMLDFFIDYVNYQKLGQIDNSHLVHADQDLNNFAGSKICLQLAQVHGKAVDFPKTGYCPPINPKLLVSVYPDFMEKQGAQQYESQSILGMLYRDVKKRIQSLLNQQKIAGQVDKDLINVQNLEYEVHEIRQVIGILRQFERDLGNLIAMVGVDTQYQIYSGNFSTAKDKVAAFGKSRLIATILHLRNRFSQIFFEEFPEDKDKYAEANENQLQNKEVFSEHARRKALLYYIVSYIYKFRSFQHDGKLTKIFQQVFQVLTQFGVNIKDPISASKTKYCGFVWFIIPKIIMNIKNINRKKVQKNIYSKKEENKQQDEKIKQTKPQKASIIGDTSTLVLNRTAMIQDDNVDMEYEGEI